MTTAEIADSLKRLAKELDRVEELTPGTPPLTPVVVADAPLSESYAKYLNEQIPLTQKITQSMLDNVTLQSDSYWLGMKNILSESLIINRTKFVKRISYERDASEYNRDLAALTAKIEQGFR